MSTRSVKNEDDDGKMRITDQFRHAGGMIYDLKGGGQRISLRMTERSRSPFGWELAGAMKPASDLPTLTVVAATRREALSALERAWQCAPGFPTLDWPSVQDALTAVRAI